MFIIPELDKRNSQRIERSIAQVLKRNIYHNHHGNLKKTPKTPASLPIPTPRFWDASPRGVN